MSRPVRALIIEDSEDDARLLIQELRRTGYELDFERVETGPQMSEALDNGTWDLVISDYRLPSFNGPAALALLQARQIDLPFIVVSGAIGEETAVELMRAGAHDYLMKGQLARLGPAVERELREAGQRKARRKAEEALRQSEERYRGVFEGVLDAILVESRTGEILDANQPACEMYGRSRDELRSMRVADLVAAGHPVIGISDEPDPELPGRPFETINLRASGEPFAVEITSQLQTLGSEQVLLVVVRDISERKRVEEAQRQVQWMKEEFIVSMSHGLRTPLHTLKGFLELLSSGKVKDPVVHQDFLARADGDAKRLINMVNDLIEAAQLESGEIPLATEEFDLSELIRETLGSMEAVARERGVRVEHSLPPDPPFVQASRDRLRQVLVNLVENAINVSAQGQAVRVVAENVGGEAISVRVIDQGPGIPASSRAGLFERPRPPGTPERDSPIATGLGLYISKRIIEAHGGSLGVESSVGKGSTFYWSIPVKAERKGDHADNAR